MIEYQEQYQRCAKDNKVAWGPEQVTRAPNGFMSAGRWVEGWREIRTRPALCGRFGGACEDHNEQCRKFRERE